MNKGIDTGMNRLGLTPGEAHRLKQTPALLAAIAGVGIKTSIKRILEVGPSAIIMVVLETVFLGGFVLIGLQVLG